jgi:ribosome recycling factor
LPWYNEKYFDYIMDFTITAELADVQHWLEKEFNGIRTGQATPALLDSIRVESYGTMMPISQVASIGTEDARTLRISAWDASVVPAIEKTIRDADLGVSVVGDSSGLRVIFPELTGERRQQLVKLAKSKFEEARVRVRGVRDDVMKKIDSAEKQGEISEDEKFTQKEKVQKQIDGANQSLEQLFNKKEAEITR